MRVFCNVFDFQAYYMFYWRFHLERKSQSIACLLIECEHIYIYIGFWTLKLKCTQYELYGQVVFKNVRVIPGSWHAMLGGPRLWLFQWYPCPTPWWVQRSSWVFRKTRHMVIASKKRIYICMTLSCLYGFFLSCGPIQGELYDVLVKHMKVKVGMWSVLLQTYIDLTYII
jgi:hypothetical protein